MRNDLKLVEGLQSNRRKLQDAALEKLYVRNLASIESYIKRNNGSTEDAQEILQDALVVIFQSVRKPNFELSSKLDTYLYGIAKNIWYKRLRKQRRQIETVSLDDQAPQFEWMTPENEAQQVSEHMMGLIRKMSPRCREILTMIYVEEKGMNETMEALQYQSVQAVRNKKSNCLKKLREHFHAARKGGEHV